MVVAVATVVMVKTCSCDGNETFEIAEKVVHVTCEAVVTLLLLLSLTVLLDYIDQFLTFMIPSLCSVR